jgi:two-component system osmolarity sensor histidine kinase EnvZ
MKSSILSRITITLSVAMVVFFMATITLIGYYLIKPITQKSATDLASLLLLSAQTYTELPPNTRPDFELELKQTHHILVAKTINSKNILKHQDPDARYFNLLLDFFKQHLDKKPQIFIDDDNIYWILFNLSGDDIYLGFTHTKIGGNLPYILFSLLTFLTFLTIFASWLVVKKITKPIKILEKSAKKIGKGGQNIIIKIDKNYPKEIKQTIEVFNKMSFDIDNNIKNRTILLSGISHDIRTPLTSMALATEMLPSSVDKNLKDSLLNSQTTINNIITQYLSLIQNLEVEKMLDINLAQTITNIVKDNKNIVLSGDKDCNFEVNAPSLQIVLRNIIDNAIKYGGDKKVNIKWSCDKKSTTIWIIDNGCGIPKDKLDDIWSPFYQIDNSRQTGAGLGLAIVRQIIDKNNWNIDIKNNKKSGVIVKIII